MVYVHAVVCVCACVRVRIQAPVYLLHDMMWCAIVAFTEHIVSLTPPSPESHIDVENLESLPPSTPGA